MENEIPLSGGNINAEVVRIGDTVRRTIGPHAANVHMLLRHLEDAGYPYTPRFLGIDDKGREILSFISGSPDFPDTLWTDDETLRITVRMLREFHDATEPLVSRHPDGWAFSRPDADVICHADFAPYNMIFRNNRPVGIIDLDLAGPGPRLWDLAYLTYWMAPLSFTDGDMADASARELDGAPRIRAICTEYGTDDFAALLDMVDEVLRHMCNPASIRQMVGEAATQRLVDGGHIDHWARESAAFAEHHPQILSALMS